MSGKKEDDAVVGSQSFYDLTCEPCDRDDKHLKALAYCQGCEEYFCHTCVKSHKRFVGTKGHVLLEGDKMPHTKPEKKNETPDKPEDECTDKCEKHRGELVKYFCPDHLVVGCTDCITLGHKSCSKAQLISSVSDQEDLTQLYDSFKAMLQKLTSNFDACQQETGTNKVEAEKQYDVALESFRKYKSEIVDALDALETVIEKEANIQKEADIKRMDEMSVSCKNITKNIADVEAEFDILRSSNKRAQLFTLVYQTRSKIGEWDRQSRDLVSKKRIQRYAFEGFLRDVVQNPARLGKLVLDKELGNLDNALTKNKTSKQGQSQGGRVHQKCSCGGKMVKMACGHVICSNCPREKDKQERSCSDCGVMTVCMNTGSPRSLNPLGFMLNPYPNDTNILLAGNTRTYFWLHD